MKLLFPIVTLALVATQLTAAKLRAHQLEPDPLSSDSDLFKALQVPAASSDPPSTGASPSNNGADLEMSDLLASASWPTKDAWDQTFTTVISGNAGCSAPLLARARISPYGFGAHMNQFANEVSLAMFSGKSISLCAPPNVRDSWARYFQDPGFSRCGECDWQQGPRQYKQMGMDISNGHDQAQVAEIKRYIYQKLFTLQPDIQMEVSNGLQSLGLNDATYVGVHIRYGDKSAEVPPVPMTTYAQAVIKMCSEVGANTVFVASDDDQAHSMLQQQLGDSYKVLEQPRLPPQDYTFRGDASRATSPAYGVEDEEKSVIIDVAALVHATGFIGTASSNIGKLVYFQRDPSAPAVSLDEGGNNGFVALEG